MLWRVLRMAEDAGGGGGEKPAAPPPAAETVLNSDANESDAKDLVKLRRELDDEKEGRKKDQTRVAELEDENRRLKTPAKPPEKAPEKKGWLEGNTFFG